MHREDELRVRDDMSSRLMRHIMNVLSEWPEMPLEEILNGVDQVRNRVIAEYVEPMTSDADLGIEGLDLGGPDEPRTPDEDEDDGDEDDD